MDNIEISSNLVIKDNPKFGTYNHDIVFEIIRSVDINLSKCIEIEPFSSSKCMIDYNFDNPMITNSTTPEFKHIIYLSTGGDYWCQWIYQFAHEYCHHLIDGNMSGELKGCIWFEESLCEASSIYNLISLEKIWRNSSCQVYRNYSQSIQRYIDNLQEKEKSQICKILDASNKIRVYKQDKNGKLDYNRDLYHRIASSILLPQIIDNQNVWKIIHHIGDSHSWNSITELMGYLVETADKSYLNSIKELQDKFNSIIKYIQE